MSFETDHKALAEAWQKLQREQHDHLQAEVNRRDDLLRERDAEIQKLRARSVSYKFERLVSKLTGRG